MKNFDHPFRKWILYAYSIIVVSLSGGLVYGWPCLRKKIIQQGNQELSESTLAGIFTIGSWTTQAGRFFFGLARDRYGTKIVTSCALFSVLAGSLGIALFTTSNIIGFAVSFSLLGFGSAGQLTLQPIASLFPNNYGTIISSLSGAFQLSGMVFLVIINLFHDKKNGFLCLAGLIFALILVSLLILPSESSFDSSSIVSISSKYPKETDQLLSPQKEIPSALSQIFTIEYFLLTLWFSICVLPLQYYLGTIGYQLEVKGDISGHYTKVQNITYGSGAILSPILGHIVDCCGFGLSQLVASILNACSFFILASDTICLRGQVLGFICYAIGRLLVYAVYFSKVGKTFGFKNYGTLVGIGLVTSAMLSLLQYPLYKLVNIGYRQEVNIVCGLSFLSFFPYSLWLRERELKSENEKVTDVFEIESTSLEVIRV